MRRRWGSGFTLRGRSGFFFVKIDSDIPNLILLGSFFAHLTRHTLHSGIVTTGYLDEGEFWLI